MNGSRIYNDQLILSTELSVHIRELIFIVNEYLDKFKQKDFFVFGDDKKRDKTYRNEYNAFLSNMSDVTMSIDNAISRLALLIADADKEMDLDMIVLLSKKSEACMTLQNELSKYACDGKSIIARDSISPSTLVGRTRKLSASIEATLLIINSDE